MAWAYSKGLLYKHRERIQTRVFVFSRAPNTKTKRKRDEEGEESDDRPLPPHLAKWCQPVAGLELRRVSSFGCRPGPGVPPCHRPGRDDASSLALRRVLSFGCFDDASSLELRRVSSHSCRPGPDDPPSLTSTGGKNRRRSVAEAWLHGLRLWLTACAWLRAQRLWPGYLACPYGCDLRV